MIRHVVFDLDGTLVDSCATCVAILDAMRVERGRPAGIDPARARAYMSRGGADMVAALLGDARAGPAADLAEFRARYARLRTPVDTLYAGVADGLARLAGSGLTLSICSNKPQGLCERVLADVGIADRFAAVMGGRPALRPKPAPDLLDALLLELGAAPADCLFVGDSELDDAVAAAAGMPFLFLTHGYAAQGWKPANAVTFDDFTTLTQVVAARTTIRRAAA